MVQSWRHFLPLGLRTSICPKTSKVQSHDVHGVVWHSTLLYLYVSQLIEYFISCQHSMPTLHKWTFLFFLWEEGPILYIIKVTQRALFVFNFFLKKINLWWLPFIIRVKYQLIFYISRVWILNFHHNRF